ncbi:LacI family DNA-binding transcriptional regulator [Nocardia vinacea]|uniref:LacI family DNA-binding transcriptional regulator n=1 Tax=Nocardia vinacea TaxID=96468 RepID=A0ABZ1YKQ2_9NOCA|nr:LacI family DNA-binding transcriptional regulator [Nocardia vinacea]
MTYSAEEFDALIAATAQVTRHVPLAVHTGAFCLDATALIPHIEHAIAALSEHVWRWNGAELKAHIEALRELGHTLKGIAELAGVSIATVSRIANNTLDRYSATTTDKLLAVPLTPPPSAIDDAVVADILAGRKVSIARRHRGQYIAYLAGRTDVTISVMAKAMRISHSRAITERNKVTRDVAQAAA